MHESDKNEKTMSEILELMEKMYDAQMSMFVQMSRLYDIFVASATGMSEGEIIDLLNRHENGEIHTAAPILKQDGFGKGYDDED